MGSSCGPPVEYHSASLPRFVAASICGHRPSALVQKKLIETWRHGPMSTTKSEAGVRQIYDPVADTPTRYRRDPEEAHPPVDYPPYKSTQLRHPRQPLIYLPHTVTEITGPQLSGAVDLKPTDSDLRSRPRASRSASASSSPATSTTPRASHCATRWWRLAGQRGRPLRAQVGPLGGPA